MRDYIIVGLIIFVSNITFAQDEKTRIIILDPFQVGQQEKMSDDIKAYLIEQNNLINSFSSLPPDSLTKGQRRLIDALTEYKHDFDFGSAFSQFLFIRLSMELEKREESYIEVYPLRQKSKGSHKELKKIATANKADLIFNVTELDLYTDDNQNRIGKCKFQLYNREMNKSLTFEFTGDTSEVYNWTIWQCKEGEFRCIVVRLTEQILGRYLD